MSEFPKDDDPRSGNQGTSNKGARNKASLRHGDGGRAFKDTDNAQSGDGHGGPCKKPLAGDGYSGTRNRTSY
jgi:hypothetical protein